MKSFLVGVCAAVVCAGCCGTHHQKTSQTATTQLPPPAMQPAQGGAPSAGTGSAVTTAAGGLETANQATIELRKEELVVGKTQVSNGGVLVRRIVQSENVSQPIELRREEYVVERIPASEALSAEEASRSAENAFQGREIYIPLMREEPVASIRTVLTEKVQVAKNIETDRETITRPVRTEDLDVVKNPDLSGAKFSNVTRLPAPSYVAGSTISGQPSSGTPEEASASSLNLAQENFVVGKREVSNGGVLLQKVVRTQDASQPVELKREEYTIERTPLGNQLAEQADFSQREITLNLMREQPVVGTRNYVAEVVRIRTKTETDNQTVSGTVRKENVEIVKLAANAPGMGGSKAGVGGVSTISEAGVPELMSQTTIQGKAMCGKCLLKESAACQTVIQVKEGDKTLTYYLVPNDVSSKFHANVCKHAKQVTATGMAQEVSGKLEFTATTIELVK